MGDMFYGDYNLINLTGLESFNTSQVTNMSNMFDGDSGLTSLDLS
ncbi:BspA family leucine-rich repeat surface protein, partial [Lactobacillus acetotolerans]